MIKYSLHCAEDHRFDSWFASSGAYEKLSLSGLITCAVCGSAQVAKALMAPGVLTDRAAPADREAPAVPVAAEPRTPTREEALRALRQQIEATSDYVGPSFAMEARKIHEGLAPSRSIYGEANGPEVRKLIEDGVQIAPLPFVPTQKSN